MIPRFNIIVAVDQSNGIAKNGSIPWSSKTDMQFFREKTRGAGKNCVIMGKNTFYSIPDEFRPLEGRHNVIISKSMSPMECPGSSVFPSLLEALINLGAYDSKYEEIYVIGGEQIYNEAINRFLYLCKRIYVTQFKMFYSCDKTFPFELVQNHPNISLEGNPLKTRDFTRYTYMCNVVHPEYQYINLLKNILENGENRPNRTDIGCRSLFSPDPLRFDISETIPLLTTKQVAIDNVIKELLWFIKGSTNSKLLEEQGVNIWKGNTSASFLKERKLPYREGDAGPIYGFQWRHWGAEYENCNTDYKDQGIDQLKNLINGLKNDPFSRRHILTAWNVADLEKMALPPCHCFAQFYVDLSRSYLDCTVYQRSVDTTLGLPYNLASYSILTHMIGHLTQLKPRKLTFYMGDTHIYNNHVDSVKNKQINRVPRPFPKFQLKNVSQVFEIEDFTIDNFQLSQYSAWPPIKYDFVV